MLLWFINFYKLAKRPNFIDLQKNKNKTTFLVTWNKIWVPVKLWIFKAALILKCWIVGLSFLVFVLHKRSEYCSLCVGLCARFQYTSVLRLLSTSMWTVLIVVSEVTETDTEMLLDTENVIQEFSCPVRLSWNSISRYFYCGMSYTDFNMKQMFSSSAMNVKWMCSVKMSEIIVVCGLFSKTYCICVSLWPKMEIRSHFMANNCCFLFYCHWS